jgi:hypothetical protein
VLDVLSAIGSREDEHWIDMESSVRTDDEFSLRKVRAVLERVAFMFPPGVKARVERDARAARESARSGLTALSTPQRAVRPCSQVPHRVRGGPGDEG